MSVLRYKSPSDLPAGVKIARVDGQGKVGQFKPIEGPKIRAKYGNVKTEVDGITFASKREAKRWQELKLMEAAHEITTLKRQTKFVLIGPQHKTGHRHERAVEYVCDFEYFRGLERVVEDTKGYRTPDYIIKRKLMLWVHDITIKEV